MENNIIKVLTTVTLFDVVKWMMVVGLVMYTAFAAIIVRQTGIMSEAIESELNGPIKIFAWAHLLMALLLIVIALVLL